VCGCQVTDACNVHSVADRNVLSGGNLQRGTPQDIQPVVEAGGETPSVGLRLAANYDKDSSCIHLNWYHHYKSKAGDKKSRDKKKSKGMFHAVVYRSIDGAPFVGIAALPSDQESYTDRDVQPGQTVRYFIKLHLTQYKQSKPSNTTRTLIPGSGSKAKN
ncbi:MAG: hypothetical protein IKS44_08135, partial [Bacteroidales bacterium]|nr:hypothetical protein [Bacteroidales bacterium]